MTNSHGKNKKFGQEDKNIQIHEMTQFLTKSEGEKEKMNIFCAVCGSGHNPIT